MPAEHGDLPATKEYFPALRRPADHRHHRPADHDAAGGARDRAAAAGELRRRAADRRRPRRARARADRRLAAPTRGRRGRSAGSRSAVKAMDLRFCPSRSWSATTSRIRSPAPKALIDRELLDGDLSERYSLGLYAGPRGTATVVLRVPNELERQRGSLSGAVVTGLGSYDGALSPADLTEAVRTGVLRYLLQVVDVLGKADREVPLATLLLGYNSSANLTRRRFGRGAGARRDRGQRQVLRDDAAEHPRRASSTSSSCTSTPRSPRSTHCARWPASSRVQAEQHGTHARVPPASWSRARACASACSTTATRATGRA